MEAFTGGLETEGLLLDSTVEAFSFYMFEGIVKEPRRYRVIDDIYAQILLKTKQPTTKYDMFTVENYNQLNKHLSILTNAGLLECSEKSKFKTTSRGLEYIQRYLYFLLFAMGGINEDKWEILEISG